MDARMRYVGGRVELDGQRAADLGRRADERRSGSRRSRSSRSTRMSALNPTRRIGTMAEELLAARHVKLETAMPELKRRLELVGLPRDVLDALPDRALRRDEAARRDGALVAARPVAPDRRRGHLGARRLDAAGRRRAARRVPRPRLRQEHDRDHARPLRALPDRRHDPRHVRRQAGREGAGRDDHRARRGTRTRSCCSRRCRRSGCASPSSGCTGIPGRPPSLARPAGRLPLPRRAARSRSTQCAEEPPFAPIEPGHEAACWKAAA